MQESSRRMQASAASWKAPNTTQLGCLDTCRLSAVDVQVIGCILVLMLSVLVKHVFPRSKYRKYLHESAALLLMGFAFGLVLWGVTDFPPLAALAA